MALIHHQIEQVSGHSKRPFWVFWALKNAYDRYRGVLHFDSKEDYICPCFKISLNKVKSLLLLNSFLTATDLKKDLGLGEACSYCLQAVDYFQNQAPSHRPDQVSRQSLIDAKRKYLKKFGRLPRFYGQTPHQLKSKLNSLMNERKKYIDIDLDFFDQSIYLISRNQLNLQQKEEIIEEIKKLIPDSLSFVWISLD